MTQDNRKETRVTTHIVTEMSLEGNSLNSCGYIENLSKDGLGILSLDSFHTGDTVVSSFYLSQLPGKLQPKLKLVYRTERECHLNYYGFKFENITEKERQAIERYIIENNLISRSA